MHMILGDPIEFGCGINSTANVATIVLYAIAGAVSSFSSHVCILRACSILNGWGTLIASYYVNCEYFDGN